MNLVLKRKNNNKLWFPEKTSGNAAYLRYSAAHSTIVLENTTSVKLEIISHILNFQIVSLKHEESQKHTVEASHNGYIKNYKKIVKRKIYFEENKK